MRPLCSELILQCCAQELNVEITERPQWLFYDYLKWFPLEEILLRIHVLLFKMCTSYNYLLVGFSCHFLMPSPFILAVRCALRKANRRALCMNITWNCCLSTLVQQFNSIDQQECAPLKRREKNLAQCVKFCMVMFPAQFTSSTCSPRDKWVWSRWAKQHLSPVFMG